MEKPRQVQICGVMGFCLQTLSMLLLTVVVLNLEVAETIPNPKSQIIVAKISWMHLIRYNTWCAGEF